MQAGDSRGYCSLKRSSPFVCSCGAHSPLGLGRLSPAWSPARLHRLRACGLMSAWPGGSLEALAVWACQSVRLVPSHPPYNDSRSPPYHHLAALRLTLGSDWRTLILPSIHPSPSFPYLTTTTRHRHTPPLRSPRLSLRHSLSSSLPAHNSSHPPLRRTTGLERAQASTQSHTRPLPHTTGLD